MQSPRHQNNRQMVRTRIRMRAHAHTRAHANTRAHTPKPKPGCEQDDVKESSGTHKQRSTANRTDTIKNKKGKRCILLDAATPADRNFM